MSQRDLASTRTKMLIATRPRRTAHPLVDRKELQQW